MLGPYKNAFSKPCTKTINHFTLCFHFPHVARGQLGRPNQKLLERQSGREMNSANVGSWKGKGTHRSCRGSRGGSPSTALRAQLWPPQAT